MLDEHTARVQFVGRRGDPAFYEDRLAPLDSRRPGDVLLVDGDAPAADFRLARVGYRVWVPVTVRSEIRGRGPT